MQLVTFLLGVKVMIICNLKIIERILATRECME